MRILAIAIASFVAGFTVHWVIWRVHIPLRQTQAILAIFMTTLAVILSSSAIWPSHWMFGSLWEIIHVAAFYVSATLAYVVAYSAIEERSPSMSILLHVADSGTRGQSRDELQSMLLDISPVEIRLVAMQRDGMVKENGDRVGLTAKGRAWAAAFSFWRNLLRFKLGG